MLLFSWPNIQHSLLVQKNLIQHLPIYKFRHCSCFHYQLSSSYEMCSPWGVIIHPKRTKGLSFYEHLRIAETFNFLVQSQPHLTSTFHLITVFKKVTVLQPRITGQCLAGASIQLSLRQTLSQLTRCTFLFLTMSSFFFTLTFSPQLNAVLICFGLKKTQPEISGNTFISERKGGLDVPCVCAEV